MTVNLLFLVAALVCFFLSAIGVASARVNLQSLGLMFLTLYIGFGAFQ